jgi:hypothetical protein
LILGVVFVLIKNFKNKGVVDKLVGYLIDILASGGV